MSTLYNPLKGIYRALEGPKSLKNWGVLGLRVQGEASWLSAGRAVLSSLFLRPGNVALESVCFEPLKALKIPRIFIP